MQLDVATVGHSDAAAVSTGLAVLYARIVQLEDACTGALDGAAVAISVAVDERQSLEGEAATSGERKEPRPSRVAPTPLLRRTSVILPLHLNEESGASEARRPISGGDGGDCEVGGEGGGEGGSEQPADRPMSSHICGTAPAHAIPISGSRH